MKKAASPHPSPKTFLKRFLLARTETQTTKQERHRSTGEGVFEKTPSPGPLPQKLFKIFSCWRKIETRAAKQKSHRFTGEGLFRKKLPPRTPSPKTFEVFCWCVAPVSLSPGGRLIASCHFAVRRNIICFPGKQISPAPRGFHLSASADKFHCVRHHAARPAPPQKLFKNFFLLAQAKTKTAKSDFPAHFHFAIRRKFICFRGKQVSSASCGSHLSAVADK